MTEDIIKFESRNNGNLPQLQTEDPFLIMIERVARTPEVDVEKIRELFLMKKEMMLFDAERSFNADMVLAQNEMPRVPKDKKNTQTNSWYASYEKIVEICGPTYTKHGFSPSFNEGKTEKEKHIRVCGDLMHRAGHTRKYYIDIPLDDVGIKGNVNKTQTHATVSSFQYGQSRLLRLMFNIPTGEGDDDGNAAGGKPIEYISEKQLSQITDMINETDSDETKFLGVLAGRLGVKKIASVETIPAKGFDVALGLLKKKQKVNREPGEEG